MRRRVVLALLPALAAASCDSGGDEGRREVSSTGVIQRPYVPIVEGTAPRGTLAYAAALAPPGPAVTPALLRLGRERFETFCTPCHGERGYGDGPVVSRGFPKPPSYHEARLRAAPPEYIVSVVTEGTGAMWSYAERVPPFERWAIAAYVKTLQEREAAAPAATSAAPP